MADGTIGNGSVRLLFKDCDSAKQLKVIIFGSLNKPAKIQTNGRGSAKLRFKTSISAKQLRGASESGRSEFSTEGAVKGCSLVAVT